MVKEYSSQRWELPVCRTENLEPRTATLAGTTQCCQVWPFRGQKNKFDIYLLVGFEIFYNN